MADSTTESIIGGETSVDLSSAATLTSLGVTVTGLGSAKIENSNGEVVAVFPITGGTEESGGDVILHQGSGLELSDAAGYVKLSDFRVDTNTDIVYADVTTKAGTSSDVAVFDIGSGAALTLTSAAASVVDTALGTTAITTSVVIGSAAPDPVANPLPVWFEEWAPERALFGDYGWGGSTQPIVSGVTDVTLTAASTLESLGVSVSALGTAKISQTGDNPPVAQFAITGGTEGPKRGEDVILHQGSGLELSDAAGSIELQNFIIDTAHHVIDADVTVDGTTSAGNLAVFNLGPGGKLTLTTAAEGALDSYLNLNLSGTVTIGEAAAHPFALSHGEAALLTHAVQTGRIG